MKKLNIYKLISRWIMRIIVLCDQSIINESRLSKRLNIKKPKIKRNETD